MNIEGKCHCGNIRFSLDWPDDGSEIAIRACGCTFCTKHGGSWTSHPHAALAAHIGDASLLSRYAFGTGTADFFVCARCGGVPFVVSIVDGQSYAVVNVNTFTGVDLASLERSATNFDAEQTGERLERRKRNWIRDVRITGVANSG